MGWDGKALVEADNPKQRWESSQVSVWADLGTKERLPEGGKTSSYNGNATELEIPCGVRLILDDTHVGQKTPSCIDVFALPRK